jgi:hypothetical protein
VTKQKTKGQGKLQTLESLNIPVPPMLVKAIGYKGKERFISFKWTPYGDEVEYSDGRLTAMGNWQAYLAYIQHPAISPLLTGYELGSSENEAKHALILDRVRQKIFVATVKEAEKFLSDQWPPEPTLRMSQEEHIAKISIALKNISQPRDIDIEEIQRGIQDQYRMIEDMLKWLDKFLKN